MLFNQITEDNVISNQFPRNVHFEISASVHKDNTFDSRLVVLSKVKEDDVGHRIKYKDKLTLQFLLFYTAGTIALPEKHEA